MNPVRSDRFVAFGEIMLRLSPPGHELLLQTLRLEVWVAGAEANVVSALARLGHETALISAVPDDPLGDAAVTALRGHGVDCSGIRRGQGRMGLYWVEGGAGLRATDVIYDRAASVFAETPVEEWDWATLLAGAGRLHLSGITPALGPKGAAAALTAAEAAQRLGVPISFDGNYRARLWQRWNGHPREILTTLIEKADILFGNHRDITLLLDRPFSAQDSVHSREAAAAAFAAFPRLRMIASTARQVDDVDHHRISARIDTPGDSFETPELVIPAIVDRIGTGDAFAAGVLHGLQTGMGIADMARCGLALSALKHSIPGDAAPINQRRLADYLAGDLEVRR
jgi:2-dehydro-3-deoxygluconokinase